MVFLRDPQGNIKEITFWRGLQINIKKKRFDEILRNYIKNLCFVEVLKINYKKKIISIDFRNYFKKSEDVLKNPHFNGVLK